jgi:hypothetical protein
MLETERAGAIFADARVLYADALEELDRGNLRNAAEKAWGATKRATDAATDLLLARTGRESRTSGQTSRGLRALRRQDPTIESLRLRYAVRQSFLHGACFYRPYPGPRRAGTPEHRPDHSRDTRPAPAGPSPERPVKAL